MADANDSALSVHMVPSLLHALYFAATEWLDIAFVDALGVVDLHSKGGRPMAFVLVGDEELKWFHLGNQFLCLDNRSHLSP